MLSALELNGFKSFADRTRFEFPPGVTVVVGPNGSGKSNVVDAIKWVLGSQSVKSLRGKEMTDVIFSGTRNRRPAGAAEASLVFDNSSGRFDHDASELQITRRVYRSGECEYLINRQACRLRDIRDLLASVGMSTGAYGIIEQGRVDAVLQASSKDRRQLFEEVAGISRFRIKREEAARRLERVEHNLLRLSDIVQELETRLHTVRAQAGRAQRYGELSKRLTRLRTQSAVDDWRSLCGRIEALRSSSALANVELQAVESRLAERSAEVANADKAVEGMLQAVRQIVAADADLRERLVQCESTRNSHVARVDELSQEIERLARQLAALASRAGDSQQLVDETHRDLRSSQEQFDRLDKQIRNCLQELESIEAAVDQARGQIATARAELAEAEREADRLDHEDQVLVAKLAAAEESLVYCDEEAAPLGAARERLLADVKRAAVAAAQLATRLEETSHELATAQSALSADREGRAAAGQRLAELTGRLAGARERTTVLEELELRLEGLASGTKEVLRRSRDEHGGPFRCVLGVVADLLQVDADSAPLVEIALGDRAGFLVATHTESLAAALEREASGWAGRTSFLRLDVPAPASAVDRVDLSGEAGIMGRADKYVESSSELAPMVRRLLGRHWFVDSLATALRLAAGPGRGLSFVTATGEAVLADGTLTVGPRQSLAGLLSRRSELRALREQIVETERGAAQAQADCDRLDDEIAQGEDRLQQLISQHGAAAHSHGEARLRAAALADKVENLDARLAAILRNRAVAEAQFATVTAKRDENKRLATQLHRLADERRLFTSQSNSAQSQQQSRQAELSAAATEQRVELARAEQRLEGLRRQMEQLLRDHAERDQTLEEIRARMIECEAQKAHLSQEIAELTAGAEDLRRQKAELAVHLARAERQREALGRERLALAAEVELASRKLFDQERGVQTLQLNLQKLEAERSALELRMREDCQIELAEIAALPSAPSADGTTPSEILGGADREAVEREIRDLRERLQSAGPVNLESLAELEAVETRYNNLARQHEDLVAARTRLEQIVQQINGESRQLFVEAVDEVRGHFQAIFQGLFAGGEADIVLEGDPSGDVLESGVSIMAQPPGKQPRSISLLSGGERTLTCVALLLAIFRARPSPFCVLDEVDAALDEANIDRFVQVLKQFVGSTQFIVITHSKRTMTCGDVLYGVTMQESGVSKRVSVRFEDVAEDGRIRPAALRAA